MKKKNLFLVILPYIAVNIGAIAYFYTNYTEEKSSISTKHIDILENLYNSALSTFRLNANSVYLNIIMQKDVLEILRKLPDATQEETARLHYRLYKLLKDKYANLKSSMHLRQLHFHFPDGRSFLRMHRPGKYGDPLFDIRYSVKIANTQLKYVEGFEEGRIFNGYRYVYPIIDNGKHLGSVEISVSMNAIIDQLSSIFKHQSFYFIIDKRIVDQKVFSSEKMNYEFSALSDNFLVDKEVSATFNEHFRPMLFHLKRNDIERFLLQHKKFVFPISYRGKEYISVYLPILNTQGEFSGYLISFERSKELVSLQNRFVLQVLTTLALSFVLFYFVYALLRHSQKLKEEKEHIDKLVKQKTKELERMQQERIKNYQEIILAMVTLTEERDAYTAGHTKRVAKYSTMIAQEMGCSEEEIKTLYEAAIMHDIGKIITPDSILLKPEKLTDKEFEIIKYHVKTAENILKRIHIYKDLVDIVKYHHEKYDGTGYPYGIKGEQIPLLARILSVADAFDAMTTNRIYKPKKEVSVAIAELQELAGSCYDPEVVKAAAKVLKNVKIDEEVTQFPSNSIEKERFSLFFKDPLTGLYNLSYFKLLIENPDEGKEFTCVNVLSFKKFDEINKFHGWLTGDEILSTFAELLQKHFKEHLLFRIFGDNFVIFSKKHLEVNKEDIEHEFTTVTGYNIELRHIHLELTTQMQREQLLDSLQKLVNI